MNQDILETLILDLIDNSISPADFTLLENEFRTNPESIETYITLNRIENLLQVNGEINHFITKPVIPIEKILSRQRSKSIKIALLSTAALILGAILLLNIFFIENNQPILTFKTSPNTQFKLTHLNKETTNSIPQLEKGSRLVVNQGSVELTFKSGVKSIVSAPADLTLINDDHIEITKGSAWFHVSADAVGFKVTTTNLNIVDLGTQFGVHSKPSGNDEIHVFKGKVSVTKINSQTPPIILSAHQARSTHNNHNLSIINSDISTFLTQLPDSLPHIHWSFDQKHGFKATGNHPDAEKITTTPIASPTLTTGITNEALSLNGSKQYLSTNWHGIYGTSSKSLSCWIKLNPNKPRTWGTIIEWGQFTNNNNYWRCRVHPDSNNPNHAILRLGFGNYQYDGSTNLADGKWHHIAIVDQEATQHQQTTEEVQFYIDGRPEPITSTRPKASLTNHRITLKGTHVIIGSIKPQTRFSGKIDELYLFYGALSAKKIKELSSEKN